jgi:atrial natriuretic peptide receptor A
MEMTAGAARQSTAHNMTRSCIAVVVVCANPGTVREILLAAEELNMVDSGEYVFFNIELFSR